MDQHHQLRNHQRRWAKASAMVVTIAASLKETWQRSHEGVTAVTSTASSPSLRFLRAARRSSFGPALGAEDEGTDGEGAGAAVELVSVEEAAGCSTG